MSQTRFLRLLFWINGAVPGLLLAWDAWHRQLGANAVNEAIRTTGLIGLIFLTLSLVVTPLRQLLRWNELVAIRRPLGLWGFYYSCVHLSLYIGLDRALDLGSTVSEVLSRRYLQVGIAAILLMIPLALTSTDMMVRRLGATRWKRLHRMAYVVVGAGILHYFLLVKSDVRQPLAFAGVAGSLLMIRAGRHYLDLSRAAKRNQTAAVGPMHRARSSTFKGLLKVARISQETPDVRTFRFVDPAGGDLPFKYEPGQYLVLTQGTGADRVVRCYTIASSPTQNAFCEITVKREPQGASSRRLHDSVRTGDLLQVTAPLGKFTFTGDSQSRVVLIAGGVGITPLMSMTRALTDRCWNGRIDFLVAARTQTSLIFRQELAALAARVPQLHVHEILSQADDDPSWTGERGQLTSDVLQRLVPDWSQTPVFLCGPQPMMDAVSATLRRIGVPEDQLHTEAFVSATQLAASSNGTVAGTSPAHVSAAVTFTRSKRQITAEPGRTVLEAAEDEGLALPHECRSGICGLCKLRLTSGRVDMRSGDALSAAEARAGYILTCQSHALEDLVIEG